MQDEMIVDLYWKRDESAISETERKYGRYLSKIAYNMLLTCISRLALQNATNQVALCII